MDSLLDQFTAEGMIGRVARRKESNGQLDYFQSLDLLLEPPESIAYQEAVAAAAGGLPVVATMGETPASRVLGGWLSRLGFGNLCAVDAPGYIAAVAAIAKPIALNFLSDGLRGAARRESALAAQRAAALEAALRQAVEAKRAS